MAVPYKKMLRKDPQQRNLPGQYYPQLVTQGNSVGIEYIADIMQRFSSLSTGDIQSVMTNFGEALLITLASGNSVNIAGLGVFSLTADTEGRDTKKECNARCIKSLSINFRPSTTLKPALTGTRGATKFEFFHVEDPAVIEENPNPDPGDGGGGVDPNA